MIRKIVGITTGDPAGIGPEVVARSLALFPFKKDIAYVFYGDNYLPEGYRFITSLKSLKGDDSDKRKIMLIENPSQVNSLHNLYAVRIPCKVKKPGKPDEDTGKATFAILQKVVSDIKEYRLDGLVTSPVSKTAIRVFDPDFIGHTEYLAREFNCQTIVMTFASEKLDVALLTTHTALKDVTKQIREELILPKLRLIYDFACRRESSFRYRTAAKKKQNGQIVSNRDSETGDERQCSLKIALLGMNPHCGEEGAFGSEEVVLESVLAELRKEEIFIDGPFPADSFFKYKLSQYHLIVSCYHDQGLIPFKLIAGEQGVNVTLGLPFFRASVDHGTAYDIAGKGIASPKSLISAITLTERMI